MQRFHFILQPPANARLLVRRSGVDDHGFCWVSDTHVSDCDMNLCTPHLALFIRGTAVLDLIRT